MPKLRFTGTIYPTAIKTSITNHPKINWKSADLGFSLDIGVEINENKVAIDCEIDNFDRQRHLTPIVMRAYDTARATIDLLSFATGNGLMFVLDTFVDPEGNSTAVAPQQPELATLSSAVAKPEDFDKILRMVLTEPPLFLALRDLIDAITQWHRAPVNTARVLDGLRHLIAPGEEPKSGWPKLRAALRVQESYLKYVTDQSAPARHGDPSHIPGEITREVAERAWTVFNRYLEYRKGGSEPLPESEFPILS
jgi:hypothetical protein